MPESDEVSAFYDRLDQHFAAQGYRGLDLEKLVSDASSDDSADLDQATFAVGALQRWLADREMIAVFRARAAGRSWSWIAERLGRTRQSLWERYRDRVDNSLES